MAIHRKSAHCPLEERLQLLGLTRPDGTPIPYKDTLTYRALQGETIQGDMAVLHRQDRTIWLSVSAAPILLPDGRLVGFVIIFTDITPLHELQERERRYLYTLAHNLRAPATLIKGNLELLLEILQPSDLTAPYRAIVDALQRALFRMSTMIDDFNLVTRLEEGPITLHTVPVALDPYLHDLLQHFAQVLETNADTSRSPDRSPAGAGRPAIPANDLAEPAGECAEILRPDTPIT